MKMTKAPREFALEQLPEGISRKNIDDHYQKLYKGYINKFNEIQDDLERTAKSGNASYSAYRELKREEVFTADAIRLHEAYFAALGGEGRCEGTIMEWIVTDFGSFEDWVVDLRAAAMSARGWVVLVYDMTDGCLRNYLSDIHSDGVWATHPLIVLDVYEHAYYSDFGPDRAAYIESWLQNVNWERANAAIRRLGIEEARKAA